MVAIIRHHLHNFRGNAARRRFRRAELLRLECRLHVSRQEQNFFRAGGIPWLERFHHAAPAAAHRRCCLTRTVHQPFPAGIIGVDINRIRTAEHAHARAVRPAGRRAFQLMRAHPHCVVNAVFHENFSEITAGAYRFLQYFPCNVLIEHWCFILSEPFLAAHVLLYHILSHLYMTRRETSRLDNFPHAIFSVVCVVLRAQMCYAEDGSVCFRC